MIEIPPNPPVITQLVRCGLNEAGLKSQFDEELQSLVITVMHKANADASKFLCMYHAVWGAAEIEFEDRNLGPLYREFETFISRAASEAQARAWLSAKGLIERLPTFAEGETPAVVIEKLERFCSIKPGTGLQLAAPGLISIQLRALAKPDEAAFECLLYTMMAADLSKTGLRFGFIGNEQVADEKK